MVFTKFAPLLALAVLAADASAMPRVDSSVHRALRQQATVNLIVTLKAGVDDALNSVKEADYATRGQTIAAIVTSLESNAKTSQSSVDALLAKEAGGLYESHQTFWITNQKSIKGATIELVEKLAALPEISEIREEVVVPLPKVEVVGNSTASIGLLANEWGVTKVAAPSVWSAGYTGQNVVIGSLDTGALATHTSIAANFRSTYNWYDATAKKTTAYDDHGHGTHTIGTMVGSNGLGVAPGAKFIACKAFTTLGGEEADLLTCAQFMTCPTDASGNNKDCSKAPNVINNSWGSDTGGDTFFASAIKTWRSANIIPVFANGNNGPSCKTAGSPADDASVIAVGATTSTDGLASFSSKGPSVGGLVKPEISAPGQSVRSAGITSNTAYATMSGTSMATPHVTGVIALLLSKTPSLTFDKIKTAITGQADRTTLTSSGYTCGNTKDSVYPNNQYGYGRINALKAINTV